MSLTRDIPLGDPVLWVLSMTCAGNVPPTYDRRGNILDFGSTWGARIGPVGCSGYGTTSVTFGIEVWLQDVIRYQVDHDANLTVRHTRIVAAAPDVSGAGANAGGLAVGDEVTASFYTADAREHGGASATVNHLGPASGSLALDGYLPTAERKHILSDASQQYGGTNIPNIYATWAGDGAGASSIWEQSAPSGQPESVSIRPWPGAAVTHIGYPVGGYEGSTPSGPISYQLLSCFTVTDVKIQVEARRWPSLAPIAGLPVSLKEGANLAATLTTDVSGEASMNTGVRPPGWVGIWTGVASLTAQARTQWLRTGAVDPHQPYADSVQRGYDDAGYFELWRAPGLVRFGRAPAYSVDNGAVVGNWTGSARSRLYDPLGTDRAPESDWQITQGADGIHATLPTTHTNSSQIYGIKRRLNAAQGQATRQFRYLRVRLTASAASQGQIALWTDWYSSDPGATDPPVSSRSLIAPVSIAQGENTFDIDLVAIDKWTGDQYGPKPFGVYGAFYGQTRGAINGNRTWNVALPDARKGSAAEGGLWDHHNPDWFAIEGLTPGAAYVIQEVTVHDLSGPGRTPFRALGSAMPGGGGVPISTLTGSGLSSIANATVRVLANGRPVAYAPSSLLDPARSVYSGAWLIDGNILSVRDLMDRWQEYFDAGAGIWTLTTNNPALAAVCPQAMMEPSDVSGAGFALDALACSPVLNVAPGFNVTVSPSVTLRLDLGGVVEGLLFDDTSRRGGQGKTVRSSIQHPPPGDALSPPGPVSELTATADADGYFALNDLFQPQYWPPTHDLQVKYDPDAFRRGYVLPYLTRHQLWADDDPPAPGKAESSAGRPYINLQDPGDPWEVVVGHRNSLFFYDLARLLRALAEQDMAQDVATGRIHRVWSDPTTGNLTAEAREGRLGLSGAPARVATVITDSSGAPRQGANPSLWVTHETGLASLVYATGDGTGPIVRADSTDGLITLGAESMALFSRSGGFPQHFRDTSTGILYAFAAFDDPAGTQTVLAVRQNALGVLLKWGDSTTEKVVATNLSAAGRPVALPNRYDGVQSLLLMHGERRFSSADQGEHWSEILT